MEGMMNILVHALGAILCLVIGCIFLITSVRDGVTKEEKQIGESGNGYMMRYRASKTILAALIILAVAMWFGPFVMALSLLAADVISQVINSWPNAKLIGYSYGKQLRDMFPNIALTLAMCLIIYPVRLLPLGDWALLLIQVPLGILVYVVGSKLIHNENYSYILSVLKRFAVRGRSETAQGEEEE